MFNISQYLEKFQKIEPEGESVKRSVKDAIFNTFGVDMKSEDISVKNKIIHISAPAALKSEIFMRKQGILKKYQKPSDNKTFENIQ